MASVWCLYTIIALLGLSLGYADFGDLTSPMTVVSPTFTVPRPHQLPEDGSMEYASQHSMVTAVAPSMVVMGNGSVDMSWSIHYLQPDRWNTARKRGVFKRQGVFSNASSLFAGCTPCTSVSTGTSSGQCHILTYSGVFRAGYTPAPTGSLCYASNYAGALLPLTTSSIPCCPSCTPPANTSVPITTGVLATNTTSTTAVSTSVSTGPTSTNASTSTSVATITIVTSVTITVPESSSTETTVTSFPAVISGTTTFVSMTETTVVPSTRPQVTLSVSTVTPTSSPDTEIPSILIQPAKVSGCGTASGSGTVVGSGTVYVGPYGIIPVVSSGTVSGFASTVIGCGSIIATSGVFIGTASITGCGEGYGSATLTGSGTVYPAILGGLIPIVSSGTVTGSGRVVGCGSLTGTGTFTVTGLYTTTITPSIRPTVNVYISYCPAEPPWRVGSNFSAFSDPTGKYLNASYPVAVPTSDLRVANSSLSLSNYATNSTLTNPYCQMCPNDAGICCPLYVACGADGHCPYTALQGCGYILFGTNIVDDRNSSSTLGMEKAPWIIAPGLPRNESSLMGSSKRSVVRRRNYKHVKAHRRKIWA